MDTANEALDPTALAYYAGRRTGFGISALALGVVAFISLLGVEKAVLAVVLGILALRGSEKGAAARRMGITAISLGALFVVTVAVLLAVFHKELAQFIAMLDTLS